MGQAIQGAENQKTRCQRPLTDYSNLIIIISSGALVRQQLASVYVLALSNPVAEASRDFSHVWHDMQSEMHCAGLGRIYIDRTDTLVAARSSVE